MQELQNRIYNICNDELKKVNSTFFILIGLSLALGTYNCIMHFNKDNDYLVNIFDLQVCRNNIKSILLFEFQFIGKYNYNYNFYRNFNILT